MNKSVLSLLLVLYVLFSSMMDAAVYGESTPWLAVDNKVQVRITALGDEIPHGVRIEVVSVENPDPDAARSFSTRLGECKVRVDDATDTLKVTDATGKQWMARIQSLDGFGRAQVPGIEISWRVSENEAIYGLGERFDALNVAGRRINMWIVDAPGQKNGESSYFVSPVLYSSAGYGLFADDNPEGVFDLNSSNDGWHRYQRAGKRASFVVLFGSDVPTLIRDRTKLVGGLEPAPDWAYLPWISKNSYENQEEAEAAIEGMRSRDLPFGVIVLEAWKGESGAGRFNRFSIERWPDVEGFIKRCNEAGIRIVLWQVPILHPSSPYFKEAQAKGYLVRDAQGNVSLREEWLAGFGNIDFLNPQAVAFYKDMLRPVVRTGISGFKADDGEAIKPTDVLGDGVPGWQAHNAYSARYNQATYEVLKEEGVDGMLWARSGSLGIESAPGLWAGDQEASWTQLRQLVIAGLSSSISGMPYWGHDIGGYYGECSPELYIRWLQFGALSPFMQFHGIQSREPWHFGDEAVEAYRLLAQQRELIKPILIELGREASVTGIPIMRPMFFVTGNHDDARIPDQYMLGDDLLVAPVLTQGATGRVVRFPEGRWRHAISPMVFDGPGEYSIPIGLVDVPLFIREGSILDAAENTADKQRLLNLQAPLLGMPGGEKVLLRFQLVEGGGAKLIARWRYHDEPDRYHDAPINVLPGGEVEVDLTPGDICEAVDRRQVYELYVDTQSVENRLIRGEVDWHELIKIEVDRPYVDVVTTGDVNITGHVQNRTENIQHVSIDLIMPDTCTTSATSKRIVLSPGQTEVFEWTVDVTDKADLIGDGRIGLEATIDGITYDKTEKALIFSPRWLVAGPFPAKSKADAFTAVAGAEWSFEPDVRFPASNGYRRWEAVNPHDVADMNGLDFNKLFGTTTDAYVYATTLIHSDRDQAVQLRAGSDDTLSVWVNNHLVHSDMYDRAAEPDQNIVEMQMHRGVNRIVIKVAQGQGGWALLTRFTRLDGGPVEGLTDAFAEFDAFNRYREANGRVINAGIDLDWRCIGPFKYDPNIGVTGQRELEQAIERNLDLPERVEDKSWSTLNADNSQGWYNLQSISRDNFQVLYCATRFELDRPTEVELRCGSDDGLVVWVDGQRVIDAELPRAYTANDDIAKVKLDKGTHRLVARISQGAGDWAFSVKLWDVSRIPAIPLGADR